MNAYADCLAAVIDALNLHDVTLSATLGRSAAIAGPRSMVDVTLISRVIDSLDRRRGAVAGLPADAVVVAYDELCYAFGSTFLREVEGFDYRGFLRGTLGIRGGR